MELLTEANFGKETKKGKTVIDLYAEWCGPCKMLKPVFEVLPKNFPGIKFFKVNVDEEAELASELGVMSIPTILFYMDGEEVGRHTGLLSEKNFKEKIEELFG